MFKVKKILQAIMTTRQNVIQSEDRVSLIKFNQSMRRVFTLVQKDTNFTQLRNQIDTMKIDYDENDQFQETTVDLAIWKTIEEFSKYGFSELKERRQNAK